MKIQKSKQLSRWINKREYNDSFPTAHVILQDIVNRWWIIYFGARQYLFRETQIKKVKKILGNRFDESLYPDAEDGLNLLLSDINFEESKKCIFDHHVGTIDGELETYNKYFGREPNQDSIINNCNGVS